VWAYTRHYLNLRILYSVTTTFVTVGPFELNWETQQYKCWIAQYITFALLASLQSVNVFWFYAILRIAKRYVWDAQLADDRSVEEGEEEEQSTEAKREKMREAGAPREVLGTPQVLLNGMKIEGEDEEVDAIVNGKGANGNADRSAAMGVQREDVGGTQRTIRSRKI
jgi:acyl-CoA-dependent ceramide synthase